MIGISAVVIKRAKEKRAKCSTCYEGKMKSDLYNAGREIWRQKKTSISLRKSFSDFHRFERNC